MLRTYLRKRQREGETERKTENDENLLESVCMEPEGVPGCVPEKDELDLDDLKGDGLLPIRRRIIILKHEYKG